MNNTWTRTSGGGVYFFLRSFIYLFIFLNKLMNGAARLQLPKKKTKKNKKTTNNENEVQAINYPALRRFSERLQIRFRSRRGRKGKRKKKKRQRARLQKHMAGSGAARKNVVFQGMAKETCASGNLQALDAPLVNHGFRPVREA